MALKKNKTDKGKTPAFSFYASDFYLDTIAWSDEMVGRHIRLMCQQWVNDYIEADEDGYPVNSTERQKQVFDKIKHKYFTEKNGGIKNKRLDKIKKEKKEFIKNARKAGAVGASRRWGKDSKPYSKPYSESDSENMALQSSSSISNIVNTNRGKGTIIQNHTNGKKEVPPDAVFELLRRNTDYNLYSDRDIWEETSELMRKYDVGRIQNLPALVLRWVSNMKPKTENRFRN